MKWMTIREFTIKVWNYSFTQLWLSYNLAIQKTDIWCVREKDTPVPVCKEPMGVFKPRLWTKELFLVIVWQYSGSKRLFYVNCIYVASIKFIHSSTWTNKTIDNGPPDFGTNTREISSLPDPSHQHIHLIYKLSSYPEFFDDIGDKKYPRISYLYLLLINQCQSLLPNSSIWSKNLLYGTADHQPWSSVSLTHFV